MKLTLIILATLAALAVSCSGASALAPIMDPASIINAADLAQEAATADGGTFFVGFDVEDWSDPKPSYGGAVAVRFGDSVWGVVCKQDETAPDGWVCEGAEKYSK